MPKVINLLSYHIADEIEKYIHINHLSPNSKLPSERELSKFYSVNRVTLRNGLQILVDNGILYSIPNNGYFVSFSKILRTSPYFFFPYLDPLLKNHNYIREEIDVINSQTRLVSIPFSNDDLKDIKVEAFLEKIDDTPISISYFFQSKSSLNKYPNLFKNEKIDAFTQIQKFRIYHANDNEMQLLGINTNETLILISEFIKDKEQLIAVCESIVVGSRCEIKLDIQTSHEHTLSK